MQRWRYVQLLPETPYLILLLVSFAAVSFVSPGLRRGGFR